MLNTLPDVTTTPFTLPADAKFVPVTDLSPRLRARIGAIGESHSVITRPGFRVTTRLVPQPLAALIAEFRTPSLVTDAVLRFARTHDQDPADTLELAFDALATLVDARILVADGSPDLAAPTPTLAAGQAFAGFEIEALVRSLDDTEVYRAHGPGQAAVALKISRDARPHIAQTLANEAQVLARLDGVDVPRLVGAGVERERAYVAMEWCDGVSIAVAAQQARAARDRGRLHALLTRMLEVYARLHERGVLHGDIHQGNCLVRDDGRVVLVDFGNARAVDHRAAVDPLRSGIPQFYDPQMAAALIAGELPPAATAASEQYSLGVFVYLLLTGLQPMDSAAVQDELLQRIVERPPLPFAARGIASWPAVEAVLGRSLAKSAADRFPDVAAMTRAFASAATETVRASVPGHAIAAFEAASDAVRMLAPNARSIAHIWLGLRAALLTEDPELLAAADVLVSCGESGYTRSCLAALVARARSDVRGETSAISTFLAAATMQRGANASRTAIFGALAILEGALARSPEVRQLGDWAAKQLDGLIRRASEAPRRLDPRDLYLALALCKTGLAPVAPELRSRLDNSGDVGHGHVWLWGLAYDVLGERRFLDRSLAAPLPRRPMLRVLGLLRRYQLTGDGRWVDDAAHLVSRAAICGLTDIETALLVTELQAPERATLPPFLFPFGTRRTVRA
jgi:predicted Ser/Thr protein kinase